MPVSIGAGGAVSGATALTFQQPLAGAVARTANAKMADIFSARDFGAVGNGVVDDAVAINATIAAVIANGGGTAWLPRGTYKIASPIIIAPNTNALIPNFITLAGGGATIIPTAAVTTAIAAYDATGAGTHKIKITGIRIDGSATTNATGIRLGGVTLAGLTAYATLNDVAVFNFTGATAVGISIECLVGLDASGVYADFCNTGVVVGTPAVMAGGGPTVIHFRESQFRESAQKGVNVVGGIDVEFTGCVFESNFAEGLYSAPTATPGAVIHVRDCWFENNARTDPATIYALKVDGSGTGAGAILVLRDTYISIPGTTKYAYFKSASVLWDNITLPVAGCTIDSGCLVNVVSWLAATDPNAAFVNVAGSTLMILSNAPRPVKGTTGAIASNTFTTIFAPAAAGRYEVTALLLGVGSTYFGVAQIVYDGANVGIVRKDVGANLDFQIAGGNVQVKQLSGSATAVNWNYLFVPIA